MLYGLSNVDFLDCIVEEGEGYDEVRERGDKFNGDWKKRREEKDLFNWSILKYGD